MIITTYNQPVISFNLRQFSSSARGFFRCCLLFVSLSASYDLDTVVVSSNPNIHSSGT